MKKTKVYDVPTRVFHWIFAIGFICAFILAKTTEGNIFPYHMLWGMTLGFIVILRILWGFFGTRYARFRSFILKPKDLVQYFNQVLKSKTDLQAGHNAASSWATILMIVLTTLMIFTGLSMILDFHAKFFEDIHEVLAYMFLSVVVMHILGIIMHLKKHKDAIGMSMLHGCKKDIDPSLAIPKTYPFLGFVFFIIAFSFLAFLSKNYDIKTGTLTLSKNIALQLGDDDNDGDNHGAKDSKESSNSADPKDADGTE